VETQGRDQGSDPRYPFNFTRDEGIGFRHLLGFDQVTTNAVESIGELDGFGESRFLSVAWEELFIILIF